MLGVSSPRQAGMIEWRMCGGGGVVVVAERPFTTPMQLVAHLKHGFAKACGEFVADSLNPCKNRRGRIGHTGLSGIT
jgi:hypothetical protein